MIFSLQKAEKAVGINSSLKLTLIKTSFYMCLMFSGKKSSISLVQMRIQFEMKFQVRFEN